MLLFTPTPCSLDYYFARFHPSSSLHVRSFILQGVIPQFAEVMSYINVVPLLGAHFNLYFPLVLLFWSGVTFFGLWARLVGKCPCSRRMKVLSSDDAIAELFDDTVVDTEGQRLLEQERQKRAQLLAESPTCAGVSSPRGGRQAMRASMMGNTSSSDSSSGATGDEETPPHDDLQRRFSREGLLSNTSAVVSDHDEPAAERSAGAVLPPQQTSVSATSAKLGWRQRLQKQPQVGVATSGSVTLSVANVVAEAPSTLAGQQNVKNPVSAVQDSPPRSKRCRSGAARFAEGQARAKQQHQRPAENSDLS